MEVVSANAHHFLDAYHIGSIARGS